jgi:hypothetical protein
MRLVTAGAYETGQKKTLNLQRRGGVVVTLRYLYDMSNSSKISHSKRLLLCNLTKCRSGPGAIHCPRVIHLSYLMH